MKHTRNYISNLTYIILLLSILFIQFGCKKFLDEKSNKAFVIPGTLTDLQALLDNSGRINLGQYPGLLELSSDDYYLNYTQWAAAQTFEQEAYIWAKNTPYDQAATNQNWTNSYMPVFISNAVLEELPKLKITDRDVANRIEGSALFLRAFSFWNLAQVFCQPYQSGTNNNSAGLPLRLTSDFNVPSVRSTVEQTYQQIISDLKLAAARLPAKQLYPTRPGKDAAFAALARAYLSMGEYQLAGLYADSSLQLNSVLMDYSLLVATAARPIAAFNSETMFHSYSNGGSILNQARANIDSLLYKSYLSNDYRRTVFFQSNGNGHFGFKGSYSGSLSGTFFNGLATDEQYLIRAECFARAGKTQNAMADLNALLTTRWNTNKGQTPYQNLTAQEAGEALVKVLTERRKELPMRGLRWSDLRRLNKDPRFAKTLVRIIDNGTQQITYSLEPNSLNYTLEIPPDVIQISGMNQNPRE